MNSPACPTCGSPLSPEMVSCPQCGRPLDTVQPSYDGATTPGGSSTNKRPLMIAAIIGALLLVAGVVAVVVVLTTGGGDDPATAGSAASASPSESEPLSPSPSPVDPSASTGSSPTGPTPTGPTPPPTSGSAATRIPGQEVGRTPATGTDEDQIRQLVADSEVWLQAVLTGDTDQCKNMSDYFTDPSTADIESCQSTFTELGSGDMTFTLDAGAVKVKGSKATVVMTSTYNYQGDSNGDSSTEKLVKKNGLWYFLDS